ncbi:Uncharacterised protein [uncultured archaeon]|nr:Uncharacterised protein [uncultured archaeon]
MLDFDTFLHFGIGIVFGLLQVPLLIVIVLMIMLTFGIKYILDKKDTLLDRIVNIVFGITGDVIGRQLIKFE